MKDLRFFALGALGLLLTAAERAKVHFIHLDHANPALQGESAAARATTEAGFAVARELERVEL